MRSRIARRDLDRGEITLLAGIIAMAIGAALAGVMIKVAGPASSAPPDVYIHIDNVVASRTPSDGARFDITYTAAISPDGGGGTAWATESKIYCIATDPAAAARSTSAETTLFIVPSKSREATMTLEFGYAGATAATIDVSCDISREGRNFHSSVFEAHVPPSTLGGGGGTGSNSQPSSGPSPSSGHRSLDYIGTYRVTFDLTQGTVSDCGPKVSSVRINIGYLSDTRIRVTASIAALQGTSTSMDTNLAPSAQFSGELPSLGFITGRFETRSSTDFLTGTAKSPDGSCVWHYAGPR